MDLTAPGPWIVAQPAPTRAHFAPDSVDIADGILLWAPGMKPARSMDLDGLLAFAEMTSPSDVKRFARRYGVLRLCKHGKLSGHCPHGQLKRCNPKRLGTQYVEPIAAWLDLAAKTQAILAIGNSLSRDVFGEWSDWNRLGIEHTPGRSPRLATEANPWGLVISIPSGGTTESQPFFVDVEIYKEAVSWELSYQRSLLASMVTSLLIHANVAPVVTWGTSVSQTWQGEGLFGGIAIQLAGGLGDRWTVPCAGGCGTQVAARDRKRRHWCRDPECRRERNRVYQREGRARRARKG